MAGKAINMCQRCNFLGGRGIVERGPWLRPRYEISLILRPILRKSVIVIFRQQFRTFDSNNFALSSMLQWQIASFPEDTH